MSSFLKNVFPFQILNLTLNFHNAEIRGTWTTINSNNIAKFSKMTTTVVTQNLISSLSNIEILSRCVCFWRRHEWVYINIYFFKYILKIIYFLKGCIHKLYPESLRGIQRSRFLLIFQYNKYVINILYRCIENDSSINKLKVNTLRFRVRISIEYSPRSTSMCRGWLSDVRNLSIVRFCMPLKMLINITTRRICSKSKTVQ